jgi:hypothetical protein
LVFDFNARASSFPSLPIERLVPFLMLVVIVAFVQNMYDILTCMIPAMVFYQLRQIFELHILSKEQLDAREKFMCFMAVAMFTISLAMIAEPGALTRHLILNDWSTKRSFFTTLWFACIIDLNISFLTELVNWTMLIAIKKKHKQRYWRNLFAVISNVGVLYRFLATLPIWFSWFLHVDSVPVFFRLCITWCYTLYKLQIITGLIKQAKDSIQRFREKDRCYDKCSSTDTCPICFELTNDPVALTCQHIFCRLCIDMWLERNSSCPMCRHQIPFFGSKFPNYGLLLNGGCMAI